MYRIAVRRFGAAVGSLVLGMPAMGQGAVPPTADGQAPASDRQTESAGPTFDVLEYQIEGNTVLSAEAIERAVTPFLGPGRHMEGPDGVEAARSALEKAYQSAGYLTVFVDVPEQRIDDGIVVLRATEGRVARLSVIGSRYFSQGSIRARVPELAEGKVPDFNEVQRELALVNRTEDRRVQPVMRAGVAPGTVETELKVEDHLPLSGTVELNDRHAPNTAPLRLATGIRYDNLWQLDHSISLSLVTAPQAPQQSRVVSLNYSIPANDQATWLTYVVNSNSNVTAIGDVTVLGQGTTVGLRYVRPLVSPARESHTITFGADYKHIQQATGSGTAIVSTPLTYLPFLVGYSGSFESGPGNQSSLNAQVQAAFRAILRRDVAGCPGGVADQFACSRQGGDGDFAAMRVDLRHSHPLGDSGSLHLRLGGQVALGPLPSAEQYAIGGADSVRGYLEAEAVGDNALLGTIEWHSADLGARWSSWVGDTGGRTFSQTYALAFLDVARAYTLDPANGQPAHVSLAGVGVGVRAKWRRFLTTEIDLAWPLKASVATPGASPRLHIRLAADL